MNDEPIVVSGISAICGLGATVEEVWSALRAGHTGIRAAWPQVGPVATARLPDGAPVNGSTLALHVARALGPLDGEGLAVVGGSTAGDLGVGEASFARHHGGEPLEAPDLYLWPQPCHRPSRAVADALRATGPVLTASTACTSGATAIHVAVDLIRGDRARRVVVVGSDALCATTTSGFASLGLHSATGCRPFDQDRDGMCLGEGAAALVIEPASAARSRGATPLAVILGFGMAVDAHHLSTPDPQGRGAIAAIRQALEQAGVSAAELGYVNAHGTGTLLNDAMEAMALGRACPGVPVSSTKGATGHTLGAAGALEAVITLLALRDGWLPPNVGLQDPVPEIDLVRAARRTGPAVGMSVNFAFGGHNTALVLGRPEPEPPIRARRTPPKPDRVRIAACAVRVGTAGAGIADGAALRAALLDPSSGIVPGPVAIGPRPDAVSAASWRRMSHLSRLVAEVALEVMDRAGDALPGRDALFTAWGTGFGEMATTEGLLERMRREGPTRVSPTAFQTSLFGTPLAHLSLILGITGPAETVSAGGASASAAVLRGIDALVRGRAPAALVLAGDELTRMMRTAWALQGADPPALGEAVAGALLVPDSPATAHLPCLTVRRPPLPTTKPVFARTRQMPAEGPLPPISGAIAAERGIGWCPSGGLALLAAACEGGGGVVEFDGPRTWALWVDG